MSETKKIIQTSQSFESVQMERDKRDKKLSWTVGAVGAVMGILGLIAVNALLPLKQTNVELYVLNEETGVIQKVTKVKEGSLSKQEALDRMFVNNYINLRERYNYFQLQSDYDTVPIYGTDEVNADYYKEFDGELSPEVKYKKGNTVVTIRVLSKVISNATDPDKLANARFEKSIKNVKDGHIDREYWTVRMTYHYEPEKKLKDDERDKNPMGFVVTSYQREKEVRAD